MEEKGAKYTVVELDLDEDGKAIRAEMADIIGRTSVPAIWIGGDFVGGCNDVSFHYYFLYFRVQCLRHVLLKVMKDDHLLHYFTKHTPLLPTVFYTGAMCRVPWVALIA